MKLNTTDFLRKSQFPPMITLGILPVLILIVLHNAPAFVHTLFYLLPAYVLLSWLCILLPGKIRFPIGLLGCAALLAMGLRLLPVIDGISPVDRSTVRVAQSALTFLVPLLLCVLLFYSLQFAAWPREKEIPFNWYAAGVIAHLIVQLFGQGARRLGSQEWEHAAPYLTASFVLFLMLVLLSMNRTTMHSASLGRQRIPPAMRHRNTAITLSLLGGALVIAGIPAIVQFVERAWGFILHAIGTVLAFIARLLETENVAGRGGPGGGMDMMPYVEYQEPGLLAIILEKVAMALALVVGSSLLFIALRAVLFKALEIIRRIRSHLAQYAATASQDYVDEITDTRTDGNESASTLFSRIRSRIVRVDERRLAPAQRIRYRYRLLLHRHPDWPTSSTARENLPPETASLYEAARYSGQEVSSEDAEAFKKAISRNG